MSRSLQTFDLVNLNGLNGFRIPSINSDPIGLAVSSAGDINGDGLADVAITGDQIYVIFGSQNLFPAVFDLTTLNGRNGFVINPAVPSSQFGYSLATLDFNMDGYSDLVIGASLVNVSSRLPGAGQTYLIYGQPQFRALINAADLNGTDGFMIDGSMPFSNSGYSVTNLGDVNNDRYPDIGMGAPHANNYAGIGYVLFGGRAEFPAIFSLSMLNGTNGFSIIDPSFSEQAGYSMTGVGDVNNDGIVDIGIGAYSNSTSKAYVVFGHSSFSMNLRLNSLNGSNGFTLYGQNAFGSAISSAGDINMDGISDFMVGDYVDGLAYVIFGATRFNSSIAINTGTISSYGFSATISYSGFTCSLGYSLGSIKNFFDSQEDSIVIGMPSFGTTDAHGEIFVMTQNAAYSGNINILNTTFPVISFIYDDSSPQQNLNYLGVALSALGDFNGDNITDIVASDYGANDNSAFVIFGSSFFNDPHVGG